MNDKKQKRKHAFNSVLPSKDKFKKLNSLCLGPYKYSKEEKSKFIGEKKAKIISESNENKKRTVKYLEVGRYLRKITNSYITLFKNTCENTIQNKFKDIFKEIENFIVRMQHYDNSVFETLFINTDQNADLFFMSMNKHFKSKFVEIKEISLGEFGFEKHMQTLLEKDNNEENETNFDKIDNNLSKFNELKPKNRIKLVILRNVQKIEKLSFNSFLNRIMNFNFLNRGTYIVLLFDITFDANLLFDKINPSLIVKMIFNKISNISSKNIYKEILYKFIYVERTLFFPDTNFAKKMVEFVDKHQISVLSFRNYFKFIIFHFFILKDWRDEEFLIYLLDFNEFKEKHKITITTLSESFSFKEYYQKKINKAQKSMFKKDSTCNFYEEYLTKESFMKFFFLIYDYFENISKLNDPNFDKYLFFFDYIQLGNEVGESTINRINLVSKYLRLNPDLEKFIKEVLIPQFKILLKSVEFYRSGPESLIDHFNRLENILHGTNLSEYKSQLSRNTLKATENTLFKRNIMYANEGPILLDNNQVYLKLENWLKNFFTKHTMFEYINENFFTQKIKKFSERVIWRNVFTEYTDFNKMTNPSMPYNIMNDVQYLIKLLTIPDFKMGMCNSIEASNELRNEEVKHMIVENIDNKLNYGTILRQFLIVFGRAGLEFSFKSLFNDLLLQFGITKNLYGNQKFNISKIKSYFFKICHEFYINGFITKKYQKNEILIKNFHAIASYFIN